MFYSNEAWNTLSGYINSQINRYWSTGNPHAVHEVPSLDLKVGVWSAISAWRTIQPVPFHETINSRPALGPTQPPIQWVPGVLPPGVKRGWGVTLTTHPHLVPRLSMSRRYTSSSQCASMACSGTPLPFMWDWFCHPSLVNWLMKNCMGILCKIM
jgi:hypothetical protein